MNIPSAKGVEWKGKDLSQARKNFQSNFEKIDFMNCRDCQHRTKDPKYKQPDCPFYKSCDSQDIERAIERGWKADGCTYGKGEVNGSQTN